MPSLPRVPFPSALLVLLAAAATAGCGAAGAQATTAVDLLITNGTVVTMNRARDVIENGVVAARGSQIVAVGPAATAGSFTAARTIDARGGLVTPGFVNTHTHASMTVFRGLGDDVPDRLRALIFPLEKALIDRELVYWGGLHGMVEMLEGGVTTFADMYYFEDEVARAAETVGMRGVLGETIVDFPAPDAPQPYGGLAYARAFVAKFKGHPLVTPAFAPHAPYSLDEARLKQVYAEADAAGVPMLMHVAEMADEVDTFRKTRNQTPVEYLEAIGVLGPRVVAAHCIFVTESDIAILRRRDVGVAHAMVANIKSAKGVAPALSMFQQGVRVGLGTDGPMSGNTLDIIGQLGYVAKVHKLDRKNRNVMPAKDVVEMATIGGARALHMDDRIGSLEAGKLADLVVIDTDRPAMVPLYDVYSALVYAATPGDVRTTIVHGKVVVDERRVVSVDGVAVRAKMREIGRRVTARVAQGLGSAGGQD